MRCNNCNNEIKESHLFCSVCGNKINDDSPIVSTDKSTIEKQETIIPTQQKPNSEAQCTKKNKKKKKHRFLKFLLILFIISLINRGIDAYKKTLDKIYITNSEIYDRKDNQDFYSIEEKIDKIKIKAKTFKKVKKATIKMYCGNLVLFEKEYNEDKKWIIDDISLPIGTSIIKIQVTLDNDKTIERVISLYNSSEKNIGNLDQNDNDKDKLLNYQEEIYSTDKNKADTDNDGLTDYQELFLVKTNPMKYSTYKEGLSDYYDDYDLDQLKNFEELEIGTSPISNDTDGDGLSDYEEKVNNTNSNKNDTDNDGVSDYDEIKNFNSDPLTKTSEFSGKVESENKDVSITLNNMTLKDLKNTTFEDSGLYQLNENMAGYIMPAYNISTTVPFTTATITFNFEQYNLEKDAIPTIYYFNEKTKLLEELPTQINGKTATTTVNHFSTYILVDKNKLNGINQIDSKTTDIKLQEKIDAEALFFVSLLNVVLFDSPMKIIVSPDMTLEQAEIMEKKLIAYGENTFDIDVEVAKSRTAFKIKKKIFDFVSARIKNLFIDMFGADFLLKTETEGNSYVNQFALFVLWGYYENITGAEEELTGEQINIFDDQYITVNLDDKTDTNNDGLSDSYTAAIVSGAITTSTGINPFEGYTLNQIQENDDLDNDGIKNGEEIKVSELNGKYYIDIKSSPTLKDSDDDGLEDSKDASPLLSIMPGFKVGTSLKEDIDISSLERQVKEYNSLFNTGKFTTINGETFIEYTRNGEKKYNYYEIIDEFQTDNGTVYLPNSFGSYLTIGMNVVAQTGSVIGAGDAEKAYKRYYEKSSQTYTENDLVELAYSKSDKLNEDSIYASADVQEYIKINSKKIMDIAESNLKTGQKAVIKTIKPLKGSGGECDKNINVFGFLNNSSSHMIAEVTNKNNKYTMKLRYFIVDSYDWKSSNECDIAQPACVTENYHFNSMLLGKAKAFVVKIEYDMELVWSKGQEATIKLKDNTPYA